MHGTQFYRTHEQLGHWKLQCSMQTGATISEILFSQLSLQHSQWPSDKQSHGLVDRTV